MADAGFIGSSGAMVTATFETLGAYYQSYILEEVGKTIAGPAGALVYTVGAIMAMTGFMMTGKYKMGLWFFLGPGIFFLILASRTETTGSGWIFGIDIRPQESVTIEFRNVVEQQGLAFGETANVSSLYAIFNRVTSRVIREIVRVLNNGREKADIRFVLRAEIAAYMRSQNNMENGLREMLQGSLLRNCGQYVDAGRTSKDVSLSEEERSAAAGEFARLESTRDVRLGEGAITYISGRLVAGQPVDGFAPIGAVGPDEYQSKLDEVRQQVRETPLSCADVWKIVYRGVLENAKRTLQQARDYGKANGMDEDEQRRFDQDFARLHGLKAQAGAAGPERADAMARTIALYTLRNETNSLITSPFIDDYVSRGRTKDLKTPSQKQLSQVERARTENKEWSEKTRAMTTAATLPYYQGIGLMILSIAFPFFAILLLVPGKHTGFLLWFQLWVWLKSWDIGFAIVMMLDDLLFSIMGTGPAVAPNGVELSDDLAQAFFTLKEIDPTFQMGTYYTLIALALQSIPVISSYLVMGSASAGSSLISAGAQPFADDLAGGAQSAQGQFHTTGDRYENLKQALGATERGINNANAGNGQPGIARPIGNPLRGDIEDVNLFSSFEGKRPWGNDPSEIRPIGGYSAGSAAQMAEDAEKLSGIGGLLSGLGSQIAETKALSSQIQSMIGKTGKALDHAGGALRSIRNSELEAMTKWDNAQYLLGDEAQARVSDGRLYGGFEIPQGHTGGFSAERDSDVNRMKLVSGLTKRLLILGGDGADLAFTAGRGPRIPGTRGGAAGAAAAGAVPGVIGPAGGPAAGAAGGPGVGGAAAAAPGVIGALMWMLSPNDAGAAEGPLPGAGSDGAAGMTRDALQRAAAVAEATGSTGGRSNGRRVVRRLSIRTVTEPPIYSDQLPDDLIDQGVLLEGRAVPNGANGAAENYLTRGIFGQSEVTAPMTGVAVADSALEMQKDFIAAGGRDRDTSAGAATANGVLGSAGDGVLMLADGTIVQVGPSGMPIVGSARDISQIGIAPTQSEIDAFALLNSENTRLLSGQGIEPLGGSTNGGSEPSALAASAVNGQSVGWISDGDVATPNGTIVPNRERPDLSTEPTVFKPSVFGDASDYAGPTATLTAGENATGAENSAMPIPGFAGITLTGPSESSMFGKNNFMPGEMATLDIAAGVNPKESRPQDSLSAEPSVFTAQVFGGVSDYVGPRADSAPEGSGSNIARTEGALSGFEGVMLSTPSFTSVGTARPADSSMFGTGSALTGETASLGINAKETRQQDSLSAESSVFTAQVFGGTSDYAGSGAVFASGGNGRDGASTGSLSGFERVTLSTPSITSSNFVSAVETPANIAPVVTTSTSQSTSWFAAQDPFTSGLSSTTSAFGATAPESSAAVASNAGYVSLYGTPTAIETARPVDNAPSWGNSFIGQEKSSSKPIEIAASNFDTSRSAEVSTSKNVSTGFGNSSTTDAPASGFADSMQTFNAVDTSASVTSAASGRDAIPSAGWAFSSDSPEFVASRPIENNTTTNSWTVAEIEAAKQDRSAAETPVEKSVERAVELTVEKPLEVVEAQPTIAVEPAVVVVTPTVEQPAPVVSNAVESSTVESAAVEVAAVTAKATARKTEKPNRAARKSAAQVIIHAPEEEKKTAPTTDVSPDPNDAPSVGMAMDENRLTAERERLEQVAAGVVESLKKLEPGDPVAAAVSGTTEASIRSISYRAADGFDRPVVVIDGIRDDGHLIVANDDVVRELTAGGSGIVARPTAGAQLADPDTTVVISATEAGTLVGLEQSVALAERNGGERGAIERMVEQLDLTRADLAGALSREFARLDGALEFGALKAQNDYLKAQHERATFESDEAITRYLAQGSGLGKTDYVANLVERYGASLYGSEGSSSELSDQFVERLPGREVFSEQYVKPLEQSAFQYQQNRAAELQHWSLSESVNGESRLSFDTVTALGLGLQTTGATFEEQKREQQQLVVALSSRLITPDAQPQLAVQLDGENIEALRTAFQYTVGADAELKFEDYARVVQQLTRGNDTEAKRWLSGDQFIALVKEFGKPQGTT